MASLWKPMKISGDAAVLARLTDIEKVLNDPFDQLDDCEHMREHYRHLHGGGPCSSCLWKHICGPLFFGD